MSQLSGVAGSSSDEGLSPEPVTKDDLTVQQDTQGSVEDDPDLVTDGTTQSSNPNIPEAEPETSDIGDASSPSEALAKYWANLQTPPEELAKLKDLNVSVADPSQTIIRYLPSDDFSTKTFRLIWRVEQCLATSFLRHSPLFRLGNTNWKLLFKFTRDRSSSLNLSLFVVATFPLMQTTKS